MNKYLLIALAVVATFAGGYFTGKGQKEIITNEKIIKGETQVVTVEKVVTVVKTVQPDGTVTETTKTEERQVDNKQTETATDKHSESRPIATTIGVGGGVKASLNSVADIVKPDYYISGSYRMLGDIWVESSVATDKSLTLGVRVEL